jgi:hypothetical protein
MSDDNRAIVSVGQHGIVVSVNRQIAITEKVLGRMLKGDSSSDFIKLAKLIEIEMNVSALGVIPGTNGGQDVERGFNEELYQRIKLYFQDAWTAAEAAAEAAGDDISEALDSFVEKCIDEIGDQIVPYMGKYYRDVLVKAAKKGSFIWNETEEIRYEKAKPLLEAGFQKFLDADKTLKDYIAYIGQALKDVEWSLEAVRANLKRFLMEKKMEVGR